MTKEEITIPRWLLERIEDTLQIQYNINHDKKTGESCQDRNIKESLNGVRKLLRGEELTGVERVERLQPSLPSNLDEAAIDAAQLDMQDRQIMEATNDERLRYSRIFRRGFKAGSEWTAGQGVTLNISIDELSCGAYNACVEQGLTSKDDVIVQIRKKQ